MSLCRLNTKKGFTFIELILYMGLITIVISALSYFGIMVVNTSAKNTTQQKLYGQLRFVSERMKYEIRNATGINTVSSDFGINFATNAGKKLSLQVSGANNPTEFDVASGRVRIKQGAGVAIDLTSNEITVTNLTFTNYSSGDGTSKNIQLTIAAQADGGSQIYKESLTIQTDAEIRTN